MQWFLVKVSGVSKFEAVVLFLTDREPCRLFAFKRPLLVTAHCRGLIAAYCIGHNDVESSTKMDQTLLREEHTYMPGERSHDVSQVYEYLQHGRRK